MTPQDLIFDCAEHPTEFDGHRPTQDYAWACTSLDRVDIATERINDLYPLDRRTDWDTSNEDLPGADDCIAPCPRTPGRLHILFERYPR